MNFLINLFLFISKKLPKLNHPFNQFKNWILDLNYSKHEFETAKFLEQFFWHIFDFNKFNWKTILDIWCWWWWKWVYLSSKYNARIIWIDTEKNFIWQARQISKEKQVEHLCNFRLWDALNLDIENNSIDYIILNDVIEHIPNTKKMFLECYRVLKPKWKIFFNFAPYYEFFWHHLWDNIPIPWLHIFTTESFRIKLYKKSCEKLPDWQKRINLRIWKDKNWKESFTYLNKITRKEFLKIQNQLFEKWLFISKYKKFNMLKNLVFLEKIPIFNEFCSRLYIWIWEKNN